MSRHLPLVLTGKTPPRQAVNAPGIIQISRPTDAPGADQLLETYVEATSSAEALFQATAGADQDDVAVAAGELTELLDGAPSLEEALLDDFGLPDLCTADATA